ncbi:unnamed protein product [Camellia sinensis]
MSWIFKKKRRPPPHSRPSLPPPPPPPPPPPREPSPPPPPPPEPYRRPTHPFLFPKTQSTVLPDPSLFFSPHLLSSPLPTNSFFQNFVLKNGDQPEYIHPYLIKFSLSSLTLCYPSQFSNSSFIYQVFNSDLTIFASNNPNPNSTHIVSSFSDLSVTLDLPSSNLRFFLVRGSPYLTCVATNGVSLSISTIHAILQISPNSSLTKYTIKLNNNQTWLLYASSPINLSQDVSSITSNGFSGIIRITIVPNSNPRHESILDRFSHCHPVSGHALFSNPFCLEYKWDKRGWGDLLMLAHPLHLQLLSSSDCKITVLDDFKYRSIDGDLVGVVGDSWVLKSSPVSVTWHSIGGINEESYPEIVAALIKDVEALNPATTSTTTTSSYFYGKQITRAARLVLIAEEVGCFDAIPGIRKFLKDTIEPWLDGTFSTNGFLYDGKWGGIVTKQGSLDSGADFEFGIYNDHHYHLGLFLYAIAVLAKIDPTWGRNYRPQAYSLMADFMNLGKRENSKYPRLRCFDLWKLHSWAGGLTEFADGRNQESTSEAVNAYYAAALMGLAYGDTHLVTTASTIAAMEIHSAQTWWHVREGGTIYAEEFTRQNRVVGVLWANKRDNGLWFAPAEWRECRVGIQLLPLSPITEVLFCESGFVRDLVAWASTALEREGVLEGWKGFLHALEGVYDKENALRKIRNLNGFDDGNSLTNLLWWIHSRVDEEKGYEGGGKNCWFGHYCH